MQKENNIDSKTETNERGKSPLVNCYIEQIRKIYEIEHDNIRLQQCQLQKKLLKTKEANERQINFLNSTINEMKSQNENNIQNLIKENEVELKEVLDEKEKEINMLSNKNFELEIANNDLIEKINGISDTIAKTSILTKYFFLSDVCLNPSAIKKAKIGKANLPIALKKLPESPSPYPI